MGDPCVDCMHGTLQSPYHPSMMRTCCLSNDGEVTRGLDHLAPQRPELLWTEEGKCTDRMGVLVPVESIVLHVVVSDKFEEVGLRFSIRARVETGKIMDKDFLQLFFLFRLLLGIGVVGEQRPQMKGILLLCIQAEQDCRLTCRIVEVVGWIHTSPDSEI